MQTLKTRKKMVENIENNSAITQVFTEEWVKELKAKKLF